MRPLTAEDYREMWVRRKWWFLGATFLIAAGTCMVAALIPNQYQSTSLILLEGPQVSQDAVKPLNQEDVNNQLQGLEQQTLSRTRLEQVVREMGLVPAGAPVPDSLVDAIKSQIDVKILTADTGAPNKKGNPYAFTVGFTAPDAHLAQKVDNELASFFVSQKLRTDERTAQDTVRFMKAQLDGATSTLKDKEQALMDYKKRFNGQLPMDESLLLQTLARLQSNLQANDQALERAHSEASGQGDGTAEGSTEAAKTGSDDPVTKMKEHLVALQGHLADLQSRDTPTHPDIIKTKREIAEVQAGIAQAEAAASNPSQVKSTKSPQKNATARQENRQENAKAAIAALEKQQKQLNAQIAAYQANLQAIPLRQQEYTELQKDYEGAKSDYSKMLAKYQDALLASNVESGSQGARFRIQDFASLPDAPSAPVRWKINLGGVSAAFLIGLILAGGMELSDSTFKSDRDVEYYLEVRNLATVPELQTEAEFRQARRKKLFWMFSSASIVLVLSGLLGYLYFVRK